MRGRDVVGVGRETSSGHLGVNLGTARKSMVQLLKYQRTGTFAEHETVAVQIEGTAGSPRVVVAGRQGPHVAETSDADFRHSTLAAADNHHVGLAEAYQVESIADGSCRRSAGSHGAVVGAAQAVTDGYLAGADVGDDLRHPVRAEARRASVGGILYNLVLERCDTAHAGTPHNTRARFIYIFVDQTGVVHGLVDSHQPVNGITVEQAHLFLVKMVQRVETLELRSNAALELLGVKMRYRTCTANAGGKAFP